MREFDARVRKALGTDEGLFAEDITYVAEPKFDGLSIELVYEDGALIRGFDARRWRNRRGRDRERAHHPRGAAAPVGKGPGGRRAGACWRCAARR